MQTIPAPPDRDLRYKRSFLGAVEKDLMNECFTRSGRNGFCRGRIVCGPDFRLHKAGRMICGPYKQIVSLRLFQQPLVRGVEATPPARGFSTRPYRLELARPFRDTPRIFRVKVVIDSQKRRELQAAHFPAIAVSKFSRARAILPRGESTPVDGQGIADQGAGAAFIGARRGEDETGGSVRVGAAFDSPRKRNRSLFGRDGFPAWAGFRPRASPGGRRPLPPRPRRPADREPPLIRPGSAPARNS